ncbi:hypothetical protein SILAB01_02273 [Lacticaseibacillus paracasei]|uniref:YopX family protein n=1 Tax=Lacticaseibacillus paracasei TaxID=1597 RepID=UPI00091064C6|nr:YopX family protein [Lacticaseibacillus paracasei]GAV18377.1 hypothetical protein SILAB01_02273 [Lacticaseibacillus paracasei]
MKREIKFRAFLNSEYYEKPCMLSWEELLEQYDAIDMFQKDLMTLMQYTGLKDKNGREIYEGDLFEHRFGYMVFDDPPHDEMGTECGVVVLEDGQFGVKIPGLGVYNLYGLLLREGHLDNMPKDDLFVMKIAGNIYENPELLEGKQ